jgi:hypothetical protein
MQTQNPPGRRPRSGARLMLAGLSAAERAMLVELLHKAAQARQRRDGEA